jgi:hypothetical protein
MAPPRDLDAQKEFEALKDDVFEFVRKSEAAVIDVGRKWADAVGEFMPVEMPLVREMTKQLFDFLDELLRIQREFALQMLDETRKAVAGATKPVEAKTGPARAPRTAKRAHKAA